MKFIRLRLLVFALIVLFMQPSMAFAEDINKNLSPSEAILPDAVEKLIAHSLPNADIGVVVADAQTGKVIYDYHGYQAFTPASNLKLFTAAAALFILGPDYRYQTSVSINKNELRQGTLTGPLVINFVGDPSFTTDDLNNLIQKVKNAGVHAIDGDVVINTARFLPPFYGRGWSQDDLNWYYAAPVTSVILNENKVPLWITPSKTLGDPAKVEYAPSANRAFTDLKYNLKTVSYATAMTQCELSAVMNDNNQINITGCWPLTGYGASLIMAIKNPNLLAKQALQKALQAANIAMHGNIIAMAAPPKTSSVIAVVQSNRLADLLHHMLKQSDNLYAESILKTMGYKYYHEASFQQGVRAMQAILAEKTDINFNDTTIFDGSGQSRYDLVTPRQVVRLLYVMAHTPEFAKIYQDALPDAGKNGTLKSRMHSFDLYDNLTAKTGSMMGVSALAGYIITRNQQPLIFAIMVNHIIGRLYPAQVLQAEIGSLLYQL